MDARVGLECHPIIAHRFYYGVTRLLTELSYALYRPTKDRSLPTHSHPLSCSIGCIACRRKHAFTHCSPTRGLRQPATSAGFAPCDSPHHTRALIRHQALTKPAIENPPHAFHMAETSPVGSVHRQRRSGRRTRKAKDTTGSLTCPVRSSRHGPNALDGGGHHRAHADFYQTSPEKRRHSSGQMTHDHEPRRRHTGRERSREGTISAQHGHRIRAHSGHRRRRRKPSEEVEDEGHVSVYGPRSTGGRERGASSSHVRTPRVSGEERQAVVIPPRIRVLRTLGLEPAIPLSENREERRPRRPSVVRRNISSEEEKIARVGTSKRSDSVSKTPANIGRPRVTR